MHLISNGVRLKTFPSRLTITHLTQLLADGARPTGPAPIPTAEPGIAKEVERLVSPIGVIGLAGRQHPVGYHFAGRRVTVRLDGGLLQLVDQGVLLRSLPNPLTPAEQARLRDARPAGPPSQPACEPVRVQRRVDSRGALVIAGQKVHVGIRRAGQTLTVEEADTTWRIHDAERPGRGGASHHDEEHRPTQGPQTRTAPTNRDRRASGRLLTMDRPRRRYPPGVPIPDTIEGIERSRWPDPGPDASNLVRRCTALRRKPLSHFTTEDLRILLGQQIAVPILLPMAVAVLVDDPFAEGDYHPGDLLSNVVRLPEQEWNGAEHLRDQLVEAPRATPLPDEDVVDSRSGTTPAPSSASSTCSAPTT